MKKIISLILSAVLAINTFAVVSFTNITSAQAADYAATLRSKGFPEIYISYLVNLHNKYPNWIFEPLNTGLEWSDAVAGERSKHSKQLIQNISSYSTSMFCKCSLCYKNGSYVVQEKPNWVSASQEAVEYYMNPVNWLSEKYIFQFESTEYDGTQTLEGIETILNGTWMYKSKITYVDKNGKTQTVKINGKEYTYSESILRAANYSGMSAYYLASKIRQEVGGTKPTAGGASGTNSTYPGIYNYYNICAFTGATDGLKWASQSSTGYVTNAKSGARLRTTPVNGNILVTIPYGTSVNYISSTSTQSDEYVWYNVSVTYGGKSYNGYIRSDLVDHRTSDPYGRPWTDPDKSIFYGARYIAHNFSTQTSGYLQKFNVNPKSETLHEHEYMANVAAAAAESATTYTAYKNANILGVTKTFQIPVFKNMPGDQHKYTTKVIKAATTTEDGLIEKTCSHCGDVIKETVPKASQIKRSWSTIECVGTVQRPQIKVYDRTGKELVYKTDFDCEWSDFNSKDAGTYKVTVKYIGKYAGNYPYNYYITKNTNPVTFNQSRTTITYTGTVQRPSITAVNNHGYSLEYKKDFTVDYSDWYSTDVGKYTASVKTVGNNYNSYSANLNYEIVPQTNVTPVLNRNVITTTGTVQRPTVTVTDVYGNKLEYKKDFTVDYSDWYSTDVGRYTVTVKMQGNYSGEKTYPYYINPKPTTFLSSAQGGFKGLKNGFTLTWNKQAEQTTGYQLQYATKRDFSNAASYWVEDAEITTATITGRAANTRYYVRIRPYTRIGSGTFYGSWDYESSYIKSIVTM